MSNSWFQFKQFRVEQGDSAMKVCTDACIQGAWTARHLQSSPHPERILDIGAGTGLLGLMLAQQTTSVIHGVELDPASARQGMVNFGSSPWASRLWLAEGDIRTFKFEDRYDFIISNPPFFRKNLKGNDQRRTAAMHTTTLTHEDLLDAIARLMQPNGKFSVMLPREEFQDFQHLAESEGYYPHQLLHVHRTASDYPFRKVGIFGDGPIEMEPEILILQDMDYDYTSDMAKLLYPYYLYL